jgi:hypothetical protein
MAARRSRMLDALTRTLLRLLAVAGLLAMLPSLPVPAPASSSPPAERTVAGAAFAPGR